MDQSIRLRRPDERVDLDESVDDATTAPNQTTFGEPSRVETDHGDR